MHSEIWESLQGNNKAFSAAPQPPEICPEEEEPDMNQVQYSTNTWWGTKSSV